MPLLIVVVIFLLIDFFALFQIGSELGLLWTLLLVLGTAIGGLHLIRRQGVGALQRAQHKVNAGEPPGRELVSGAAILGGGVLLMAPGVVSDLIGLGCLVPSARRLMMRLILAIIGRRIQRRQAPFSEQNQASDESSSQPFSRPFSQQDGRHAHSGDADTPMEGDYIPRDDDPHRH